MRAMSAGNVGSSTPTIGCGLKLREHYKEILRSYPFVSVALHCPQGRRCRKTSRVCLIIRLHRLPWPDFGTRWQALFEIFDRFPDLAAGGDSRLLPQGCWSC